MKKTEIKKQAGTEELINYHSSGKNADLNATIFPLDSFRLEHFCHVTDDTNKVIFLLSTSDMNRAKQFIKRNSMRIRKF